VRDKEREGGQDRGIKKEVEERKGWRDGERSCESDGHSKVKKDKGRKIEELQGMRE
jgi:hypothetical protein